MTRWAHPQILNQVGNTYRDTDIHWKGSAYKILSTHRPRGRASCDSGSCRLYPQMRYLLALRVLNSTLESFNNWTRLRYNPTWNSHWMFKIYPHEHRPPFHWLIRNHCLGKLTEWTSWHSEHLHHTKEVDRREPYALDAQKNKVPGN